MLQKLETVLEDSKNYRLEECVIDSLMRIDCDHTNCTKCQYALCDIEDEGMINSLMRISCNNYEYCQYCLYNMHVTDNGYVCTQDIDVNEVR